MDSYKVLTGSFFDGSTELVDVPLGNASGIQLVVLSKVSLVSLGTERMLVSFGKAGLLEKVRQQPDKVKQVWEKVQTEGLWPTLQAVRAKLDDPIPLGYSHVGVVHEVGNKVTGLKPGDRVVSNGPHAEMVQVPENLCARIPDEVSDEEAAFTVVASIGLQGIRLANPTLGETVVVVGLGLIGLLTVQMLLANGCKVIGVDLDERKCALARSFGAQALNPGLGDDPVQKVLNLTGVGADAVLITASAKGNELVSQAARMSRKRGRIVLVGVTGLELNRAEFYEKELTFQVSCSYGPGRYEPNYEGKGLDYPIGFVRWTEQRNFEAVLSMMASGALKVKELITRVVPFEDYATVYKSIEESQDIAILFAYPAKQITGAEKTIQVTPFEATASKGVIGLLGAGNFTKMTLLPALKGTGANVKTIVSAGGLSGTLLAKKFNIAQSSTDSGAVLNDPDINLVMITTRHGSHSRQVIQCLEAGKAVFVEKPLALDPAQLRDVIAAYTNHPNLVHVGFNRRFSPHVVGLKKHLGQGPHSIVATMNAGFIPVNHWVHDPEAGGGRIIGEACHMIDLCAYLTGSEVVSVSMNALGPSPELTTDCAQILLRFADGSQAVINYLANGSKAYAKERVEVYSHQRTAVIDNFVRTKVYGFRGWRGLKTTMDKGHKDQFGLLLNVVQSGGPPLIAFESLVNTTAASMAALKSLQEQRWVSPGEIINLPTA